MEIPNVDGLTLSDHDDENDLEIHFEPNEETTVDLSICLVGRFATKRIVRTHKEMMKSIWCPLKELL